MMTCLREARYSKLPPEQVIVSSSSSVRGLYQGNMKANAQTRPDVYQLFKDMEAINAGKKEDLYKINI